MDLFERKRSGVRRQCHSRSGGWLRRSGIFFSILQAVLLFSLNLFGQEALSHVAEIPAPSSERYVEGVELLAPWIATGCHYKSIDEEFQKGCHQVTRIERARRNIAVLYNDDGKIWKRFLLDGSSGNLATVFAIPREEFNPFHVWAPSEIVFRVIGESSSWYQVEINERTRDVKYIHKDDSVWVPVDWRYWLLQEDFYLIGKVELRAEPDGPVTNTLNLKEGYWALPRKIDGEWVYVYPPYPDREGFAPGWVRWKDGREILLGCYFHKHLDRKYWEEWRFPSELLELEVFKEFFNDGDGVMYKTN